MLLVLATAHGWCGALLGRLTSVWVFADEPAWSTKEILCKRYPVNAGLVEVKDSQ